MGRVMAKKTTKIPTKTVKSIAKNEAIVKKSHVITVKNADGDPDTTATILIQNKIDYTPKVSVIIPVYNVEQYLRECLDSVVNQTLKEIEIICVDDGSTDSSLEILKEYAQKDNRITVITQQNLHAGVARNAGLAVARGEYLSFLDSDDFFELNMLEKTYNNAIKNNSDIVMFNLFLYDDTTKKDNQAEWTLSVKDIPSVFNYKDVADRVFKLSNCWVWNRLYKHKFITANKLFFQNLGCANDIFFSCVATVLAKKISILDTRLVHYRTNHQQFENVTSVSFRQKYPTDLLKCFFTIYKRLKQLDVYDIVKNSYLSVATESICWSEQAFINNSDLYKQFTEYFAANYGDLFNEQRPFKNNTLNKKYIKLRNILVDAGIFKEIPRRIFYVWGANEPIRPEVQKCIDSWMKFLPDYDIVQINDESTRYFNFQEELKQNKWFKTVYERKMWAYVADYIRVKTLYNNGGIYFDTDVSVVQNMDNFLTQPAFVGMQMSSLDGTGDWVEPAICGAQKNNKFFGQVVSFYDELIWKEPIYTMPHLFDYYLRQYDIFPFPIKSKQQIIHLKDITIYPERYFIPYRVRNEFAPDCIEQDTYTIHHFGKSWLKPEIQWFLKNKHLPHVKVSVIVCVYNDEKYVSQCLNSLINQTLREIEIICVNDGSTDDSLKIIESFAQKDSRITVINQRNSGLATSRNNAIKIIRGEYCNFVDSDDYLEETALEKLYNYAQKHNIDMLAFSGNNFNIQGKMLENRYWNFLYLPKDWKKIVFKYTDCLDFMHLMAVSSCLTMYKTEFILKNKLRFPDGLVYEDNIFWTKSFTSGANFGILNEKFYKRRLHNASITHNWQKNLNDYIKINDMLLEYLKSINIDTKTFENYKQMRFNDIKSRFDRLDQQDKIIIKPDLDALFDKYKNVPINNVIRAYLLFPYYLLMNCGMKCVRLPMLKFTKHIKSVMYSHSHRGKMDMLNNNFKQIMSTIQSVQNDIQKQIDDVKSQQNELVKQLNNITDNQTSNNEHVGNILNNIEKRVLTFEQNNKNLFVKNSEPYWANVYHDTINNSHWLVNKSVSPGRWAISYIVLYVLYRILDEIKPQSILECGLGQSSKLTIQYTESHNADLTICENNPEWLSFFMRQFPTADKYTKILDTEMVHVVPEYESRTYKDFKSVIENKKFNLVLVDGPLGSKHYSRPEILDIVDNLDKSFVIMLDDMNRIGEQETWKMLKAKLDEKGIAYKDAIYSSDKSVGVLCSPDLVYLTTL